MPRKLLTTRLELELEQLVLQQRLRLTSERTVGLCRTIRSHAAYAIHGLRYDGLLAPTD